MKKLYIVGAGGAAKEVYLLIKEINEVNLTYDFKGFVDLRSGQFLKIGNVVFDVIKESEFLDISQENIQVVFGLADNNRLREITELYRKKANFEFPNIIHPSVKLDDSIFLGKGNIITSQCVFTVDTSLDSFNYINRGVHIGHDCTIGSFNIINPCSVISGGVCLEDENLIGTNATVLQYLKIGSKNIIGAGAVVTKNVKEGTCVIGVPAKSIK